jgi:hypothetical protein
MTLIMRISWNRGFRSRLDLARQLVFANSDYKIEGCAV